MAQSRQEQFDTAVRGIHAQGGPAIEDTASGIRCLYRAPDGRKCAFGHLIPDELYRPAMDLAAMRAHSVLQSFRAVEEHLAATMSDQVFYDDLQDAHDEAARCQEDGWESYRQADGTFEKEFACRLHGFTRKYRLDAGVVRELYPL